MSLVTKAIRTYNREGLLPLMKAGYHFCMSKINGSRVTMPNLPETEQEVVDEFHKLYYNRDGRTWHNTDWMGTEIRKCPLDCWIYQEIIFQVQPDIIVEAGTAKGGSALYLAHLCDLINNGHIISIDITDYQTPEHNRISYLIGQSTEDGVVQKVYDHLSTDDTVLVILDSDHSKENVLKEMNTYDSIVTSGSYLIVEDTNINGNPVKPSFGPGPKEAVEEYLSTTNEFTIDKSREKFFMTQNPNGYLKKTK